MIMRMLGLERTWGGVQFTVPAAFGVERAEANPPNSEAAALPAVQTPSRSRNERRLSFIRQIPLRGIFPGFRADLDQYRTQGRAIKTGQAELRAAQLGLLSYYKRIVRSPTSFSGGV